MNSTIIESVVLFIYLWLKIYFSIDHHCKIHSEFSDLLEKTEYILKFLQDVQRCLKLNFISLIAAVLLIFMPIVVHFTNQQPKKIHVHQQPKKIHVHKLKKFRSFFWPEDSKWLTRPDAEPLVSEVIKTYELMENESQKVCHLYMDSTGFYYCHNY